MLLGPAWRSSTPRQVHTGHGFDVVRTSQPYAAPALDQLRRFGARHGAVSAEGDCWSFYVPPGSHAARWPTCATYVSGPSVWVPPRGARNSDLHLRWITREPTGRLLTDPAALCAALATPTAAGPPPSAGPGPGHVRRQPAGRR